MRNKVLDFCRRESLTVPGQRVTCALSGGADSVALLHCLLSLREELGVEVSAAHYNHCLRGAESDGDEAFVRRLCASWGVELAVGRGDVAACARETGRSLEEAARQLRYAFLLSQPGLIATAHNADDQAETVVLNLLRGTGLRGLGAMAPRQGRVIRPLLPVTRAEVEAYLSAHGLPHREDSSNHRDDALRNRLRHHVMPLLRAENPNLSETVGRMTDLLRQDEAYLEERTDALLAQAARDGGWDCRTLRAAPAVLRRRAIRRLLELPKPSMAHVDAVDRLLDRLDGSASADLPGGVTARREYGLLRLETAHGPETFQPVRLEVGQQVLLPELSLRISAEGPVILEKELDYLSTFAIKYDMIDKAKVLWVRPRRTGDTLRLPGGQKSLKRLMIDRKIPAARRNTIPVLADGQGVLAVWQLGVDFDRMARPGEQALLIEIQYEERACDDKQI